jgi:hypothetical protein
VDIYTMAFRYAHLGLAAAGSVVMLLVLAVLGVAVTAAVVLAQARLVRVEQTEPASNPRFVVVTAVAIAVAGVFVLDRLALRTGPEDQPR